MTTLGNLPTWDALKTCLGTISALAFPAQTSNFDGLLSVLKVSSSLKAPTNFPISLTIQAFEPWLVGIFVTCKFTH